MMKWFRHFFILHSYFYLAPAGIVAFEGYHGVVHVLAGAGAKRVHSW